VIDGWQHFRKNWLWFEEFGIGLDFSKVFVKSPLSEKELHSALDAMEKLEGGSIANATENRRVGHYWLRAPDLAPEKYLTAEISKTFADVKAFATGVVNGEIAARLGTFSDVLCIGIGGSALGTQLLADALAYGSNNLSIHFIDNTDPDGFVSAVRAIGDRLFRTLVIVTSKSGSTPEPRNGLAVVEDIFREAGLHFPDHAVAVSCVGSSLDKRARDERWLARFPMWDWVGGRTSVTSAVGLLPAALCAIDVDAFISGAAAMDRLTRCRENNPALQLAAAWYGLTGGKGLADMVVLPYCDRLSYFPKYLQQLIMESLGKRLDRKGVEVCQGLTVYGNRGSTDQHSYVQQLRDGLKNFFVIFVEVLRGREQRNSNAMRVAGEYLEGFYLGTREALADAGRSSITITLRSLSAHSLGMLIALFERAVGFYAEFINVNAYDQPGVEAGKAAADRILALRNDVGRFLGGQNIVPNGGDAETVAAAIGRPNDVEMVFKWLEFLRAQDDVPRI
jgi:glucose-6-phosphate isomerase